MRVLVDRSTDETDILSLARRHRLSVYDASYLELAHRDGIPLATLNKQLGAAALATGVKLLGSGSS
jgi:predicted nucleic acid-binding protein